MKHSIAQALVIASVFWVVATVVVVAESSARPQPLTTQAAEAGHAVDPEVSSVPDGSREPRAQRRDDSGGNDERSPADVDAAGAAPSVATRPARQATKADPPAAKDRRAKIKHDPPATKGQASPVKHDPPATKDQASPVKADPPATKDQRAPVKDDPPAKTDRRAPVKADPPAAKDGQPRRQPKPDDVSQDPD